MVPNLRFPGFYEKQFKIKIGELDTLVVAGGTPSTKNSNFWGGDIRWMNSGELNLKRVYEVKNRITKEGLEKSSTKVIPAESVLIGLAGQGKTRGTVAMNFVELCINQSIAAIQPSPNFISEYLYYELDRRYEELRRLSTGDGGRGGLNLKIIRALSCILPEKNEQKKIASFLSSVDEKISQLEKKKTLLETYKRGLMQKIFSQELRFKDDNGEEFPEIIKSKLDACLISVSSGKSSTKSKSGIYPIYGSTGKISSSEKYEYEGENILIARVGANAGSIYIVNGKYNVTDNTLILSLKKDIDLYYIYFWLTNFNLTRLIFGSGQPLITGKIIKSLVFDFPQISEQQKIASFLSSIDKKIEITSTQLEKTREFKKGLLQQMFV